MSGGSSQVSGPAGPPGESRSIAARAAWNGTVTLGGLIVQLALCAIQGDYAALLLWMPVLLIAMGASTWVTIIIMMREGGGVSVSEMPQVASPEGEGP